ncbi:MAG: phosphoribosyltransferase family protein [Candidatus Paceibacterota bacterium]
MFRLIDIIFPPRADEIVMRDTSDDDFLSLVSPRLVPATRPGTVALLPFYHPSVRSAIHEAKYHGNERARRLLALALAEYLCDSDDVGHRKSYIVPVPLGKARRRERGFNQAEEVARRAIHNLGKESTQRFKLDTSLLVRTRETVSQVSLPRLEREENMRGAFGAAHPADPTSTYLIIDDVLTTGATLQAAIDALKSAGATNIIPLALAH